MSNGVQQASGKQRILAAARRQIEREARAVGNLVEQLDDEFLWIVDRVRSTTGKVVTTGSGTSGIMAQRLAHLLAVSGTPAFHLGVLDALHGGMGAITATDTVIAFSKGGQSTELTALVARLIERRVFVIAVTEQPDSPFAAAASMVAHVAADPADADPGGLIAMGSSLAAGAWGDALAFVLMQLRGHSWDEVLDIHPGGILGQQTELPVALGDFGDAS